VEAVEVLPLCLVEDLGDFEVVEAPPYCSISAHEAVDGPEVEVVEALPYCSVEVP
jgi:hypothetical protein